MSALHEKLCVIWAAHPIDLLDLDMDDVASLELKKFELKRWSSAMDELRQLAAEQGLSPLLSPRYLSHLSNQTYGMVARLFGDFLVVI